MTEVGVSVLPRSSDDFDLAEGFKALLRSPEFHKLQAIRAELNIFEALGVKWREHSHSDLLAYFLDSSKGHELNDSLLKAFVLEVMQAPPITQGRKNIVDLDALAKFSTKNARVYREWRHIDLLVELPEMQLVIGIENKIFAGEQESQIERYQQKLEKHPLRHQLMVFLTPDGREPVTGVKGHNTPCVCIGWSTILNLLADVRPQQTSASVSNFIDQVIEHIKEDIMGQTTESEIVRKILGNPDFARTIQKINQHAPKLDDIGGDIEALAEKYLGKDQFEVWTYPEQRGTKYEIKFQPTESSGIYGGYRPVFMFYFYSDWQAQPFPAVMLAMQSSEFSAISEQHKKLAQETDLLAETPPKVPQWGHWLNLAEPNSQVSTFGIVIEDMGFGEQFLREAEEAFRFYHEGLKAATSPEQAV